MQRWFDAQVRRVEHPGALLVGVLERDPLVDVGGRDVEESGRGSPPARTLLVARRRAWLRSPAVGEQVEVAVVDDEWTRAGLDPRRARRVLALVSIGFFITALDFTIVNVAFRPIEADFGPGAASLLPWTLSGYSIAFAAGLLTAGRMADAFGRKRAFLLGNVIFTAGLAWCAGSRRRRACSWSGGWCRRSVAR